MTIKYFQHHQSRHFHRRQSERTFLAGIDGWLIRFFYLSMILGGKAMENYPPQELAQHSNMATSHPLPQKILKYEYEHTNIRMHSERIFGRVATAYQIIRQTIS